MWAVSAVVEAAGVVVGVVGRVGVAGGVGRMTQAVRVDARERGGLGREGSQAPVSAHSQAQAQERKWMEMFVVGAGGHEQKRAPGN